MADFFEAKHMFFSYHGAESDSYQKLSNQKPCWDIEKKKNNIFINLNSIT